MYQKTLPSLRPKKTSLLFVISILSLSMYHLSDSHCSPVLEYLQSIKIMFFIDETVKLAIYVGSNKWVVLSGYYKMDSTKWIAKYVCSRAIK